MVVLDRHIDRRIRLPGAKDASKEAFSFRWLLLLMVLGLLLTLEESLYVSPKLVSHDLELVCMKRSWAGGA